MLINFGNKSNERDSYSGFLLEVSKVGRICFGLPNYTTRLAEKSRASPKSIVTRSLLFSRASHELRTRIL